MSESVDDSGTDTEAGEGAWAGHICDFGNVMPVFVVGLELFVNEL